MPAQLKNRFEDTLDGSNLGAARSFYPAEVDAETLAALGETPDLLGPVVERFAYPDTPSANTRLHGVVFKSLGGMFVAILAVWAIAFRSSPAVLFNLGICAVYLAMYLGGPILVARVQGEQISDKTPLRKFLVEPFDTYTGRITGAEAWLQICTIPAALLLCTIGMGVAVSLVI